MSKANILVILLVLAFISISNARAEFSAEPLYLIFPFESRIPDHDHDWIGEALADLICQVIEKHDYQAVPRIDRLEAYDSFGFSKHASPTLASKLKIAELLRATHLVYGSYDFNDDNLSVRSSIIDLRKPAIMNLFEFTVDSDELLFAKTHICSKIFGATDDETHCTDAPNIDNGDAITSEAYESFIKASLEDDFAAKEDLFLKSISLAPGFSRGIYELGILYFSNGHLGAAEETLEVIMDIRSNIGADACLFLGTVYLDSGRYSDAIEVLKKAISYGGSGKSHFLLAKACYLTDDIETALKEIDISLKLDPTDIDARTFKKELDSMRK